MAVGKLSDVHSEEFILGQNIQKYRKKRGLSQTQLADIMDVDRAAISNYENGAKGEMGFKMLRRFSRALEVSTDALLGIEKEDMLNEENRKFIQKMREALLCRQAVQPLLLYGVFFDFEM